MVRCVAVDIKMNSPAAPYLGVNTAGSRAVRNFANFIIRNTMTGIRKSPEERTHNETEALHLVFTGIQEANAKKAEKEPGAALSGVKSVNKRGLRGLAAHACICRKIISAKKRLAYPTLDKWFLEYEELDAIMKHAHSPAYYSCNSHVAQKAIRKTVEAWKSYFKALKSWRKDPSKFKAKPHIPGYIRKKEATACFTNQACRLAEAAGKLYLVFMGLDRFLCIGKVSLIPGKYVHTEVKPYHGFYRLYITYEDSLEAPKVPEDPKRMLGLDVGVGNFLTGLSNIGKEPVIIKGGWLKALNQWYNKRRAALVSGMSKGKKPGKAQKNSHNLDALSRDRDNRMRDFFYKAAHWVMRWCKENQIEVVVIGHNQGQKQGIDIGSRNNQNFVCIPFSRFISILKIVACQYGIPVIEREESYTSKASLLDMDKIPTYGKKGAGTAVFSGERIQRGLYRASDGRTLNADVNGAGNILRKEYPHAFDGLDLTYACGKAIAVTGEAILKIKVRKQPLEHYRKTCGAGSRIRHRMHREKYTLYHTLWGVKGKNSKKKGRQDNAGLKVNPEKGIGAA